MTCVNGFSSGLGGVRVGRDDGLVAMAWERVERSFDGGVAKTR